MRKRFARITVLLVIWMLVIAPAFGKKGESKVDLKGFPRFVEKMMMEWDVPGCAVVIVKDGKKIFSRGFGYRDVEKKLAATPDTLFAIGSCTKAFTATLLGILVDEGKLDWDKPVRDYLPEFKLHDPIASQLMTPVDLLCHRSGLPRHDLVWYNSPAKREELIRRLPFLEPSKSFRSTFQYNNLMFMTAGFMAGKIAGTSWEDLMRQKILAPLGMTTSNFSVEVSKQSTNFSLPYSKKKEKVVAVPFRNIDNIGPAGSINSSVNEMANWLILNLGKGKFAGKQVISEKNLEKIHTPHMVSGRSFSKFKEMTYPTYALGWGITTYQGHPVISHDGGIDGFISRVGFLPRDDAGVVILTNSDTGGTQLCSVLAYNVYDRILGTKQVDWLKRAREQFARNKKKAEEEKKKADKDRKADTTPSHKLEDYAGKYENRGYGLFIVKKQGDQLEAAFNNFTLTGQHYHYDTFEFSGEDLGEKFKATFHTDVKGNIHKVSLPLQSGVEDIGFTLIEEEKKEAEQEKKREEKKQK